MVIKVLGTGCKKCQSLHKNTEKALAISGINATVEKVEQLDQILKYGVMITPALVVDDHVILSGKTASPKEIVTLLKKS